MISKYTLVILMLFFKILSGQALPYHVERLTLDEGVSHNVVYDIYQDSEKFLWLGTMFGLVKYDGFEFVKYRTDLNNINSLSDDDIVCIYESKDSLLWIGTFGGGINSFNKHTNEFKRFTPENLNLNNWDGIVWKILEDSNNNIWIATNRNGVLKFENNGTKTTEYKNNDSKKILISNHIQDILEDDNKNIWFAGLGGLSKLSLAENSFQTMVYTKQKNVFFNSIIFLSRDKILCGTNSGFVIYSISENIFKEVKNPDSHKIKNEKINQIIISKENLFWVGTNNGVYIYDKNFNFLNHMSKENSNLYGNNVVSLFEDHSGIIWAGSYLGGVSKIMKITNGFSHLGYDETKTNWFPKGKINSIAEDSKGNIWLITSGQVTKLNSELNFVKNYFSIPVEIPEETSVQFNAIKIDTKNNIYLGTNIGLFILDQHFNLIKHYHMQNNGLSSNFVNKIMIDSNGDCWLGTSGGLNKLKTKSNRITNMRSGSKKNKIRGNYITSIYETKDGEIFVGTFKGLNKIKKDGTIEFISPGFNDSSKLSNKYLFDYYEIDSNEVWIATGNGINVLDKKTNRFKYLVNRADLSNNVIKSIVEFEEKVYISTHKGISVYNKKEKSFKNYYSSDGLGNSIFSSGVGLLAKSDKILFGGLNGITIVDPENNYENKTLPTNKITKVLCLDKNVPREEWNSELQFSHNQNLLTFYFSSLEFTNPSKNKFAYKLEGIDIDWNITNSRNVVYRALPPRIYKFSLKSSNNDGVWNEMPATITFEILPPFWQTYWFYTLLIFIIVSFLLFLHYKRLQSKIKILVKIDAAKQIENELVRKRAAEDFHDELGHHITRISLIIDILKRRLKNINKEDFQYINRLNVLSKELAFKIRDFIWSLDTKNDSLFDLLVRLKDFGDDIFYETGISFALHGLRNEFKEIKLNIDWRRHLTLIFKEAINNIVKYSGSKNVEMSVDIKNNFIKIELKDDGKGFELNKATDGNGLLNMKSRAEYLKSSVQIISAQNKGAQIVFEGFLPL